MEVGKSYNQANIVYGFYGDFANKISPASLELSGKRVHQNLRQLFDTQHGSKICEELMKLGVRNEKCILSSFLGEGIAHGLQSILSGDSGLSDSTFDPSDDRDSIRSKTLGRALVPILREYIQQGKTMDTEFVCKAVEKIRYIPA